MSRIFISQERIDKLAADGRVILDGDKLEIPSLKSTFQLRAAVYFTRLVTDEGDVANLVGRVKTEEQLRALGAELVANSVVLGDAAYDCENGFVGDALPG